MPQRNPGTVGNPAPISSALSMTEWARANQPAPKMDTDKLWFRNDSITGGNWDQLFPYQLIVVEQQGPKFYTRKSPLNAGGRAFQFTLPMPPESFSISMPFAINSSVTMGGFIEEHNGAPIRIITMSGTMGVNPSRGRGLVPLAFNFRDSVFAGTLNGATQTANAARQLQTLGGNPQFTLNTIPHADFADVTDQGAGSLTGWYQFRLLQLFFESYAEYKKTTEGRSSRLALATWKDEAVYLVSPISFDALKDSGSPFEYRYNLQFKAYKRVKLDQGVADKVKPYAPIKTDPGALSRTLNTIQQTRLVLQAAKKTIQAVGGDVQRTIFEPIRQTCLAIKDLLSIPLTVADLSDRIVSDLKGTIVQYVSTKSAVSNVPQTIRRTGRHVSDNAQKAFDLVKSLGVEKTDNVDDTVIVNGALATHPGNTPIDNASDNPDLFAGINVASLNIPPSVAVKIAKEISSASSKTRADYQEMAASIQAQADAYAAAIGASHPTYNAIYGLEDPAQTIIDHPTDDDFNTLFHLNQLALEMRRFAVATDDDPQVKTIATVAGLATQAGIAFQQPRSKFAVPFPYGATLEQLAYTYLGDPDRWFEIATLNGLQSPYVDEEGFTLPLLVNGAGNTVWVSSDDHVFVGQPVYISSDTTVRTARTVTKIDQLSPSQFMVTVDGEADMDDYITLANAKLEAFLPNTVNSQMLIYIPSDREPKDPEFTFKNIPGIAEYDSFIAVGGIDLLLTPANDLVITPDGDSRWAVGLTNIIQKVRIALSVVQGTLSRHPDFGLPIEVGMSLADLSAAQIVRATENMFASDPTFTGIKAASLNVTGPLAALSIAVEVAGTDQIIPITAQVSR